MTKNLQCAISGPRKGFVVLIYVSHCFTVSYNF